MLDRFIARYREALGVLAIVWMFILPFAALQWPQLQKGGFCWYGA